MKTSPDFNTLPQFYQNYVGYVKDIDLMEALKTTITETDKLLRSIPENRGAYRYADAKWSIKEVICHIMDSERVFAYRALRFARNDQTGLPGFDEKTYAPEANAHSRTLNQLADELKRLRDTTIDLFQSFTPEMMERTGKANNNLVSVINLGYIIAGHETHHRTILKDRYLNI